MRSFLKAKTAMALALVVTAGTAQANDVEVLHWWTSGGEAAALNVLKGDLEGQGIGWTDMPVAGGGGEQAMTVLRARVTAGNAPTAVQGLGFDILDWAKQGSLANLNDVAAKEGWDEVVPAALQAFAKVDGQWVSAPVNVHSTNWVWANKSVLDANGIGVPTTWEEFTAALDTLKAAGVTPIAHGGQAWQDTTVFDAVAMSVLGTDGYKAAFIDLDEGVLGSDQMVEAFERMAVIRANVDDNFSGRDWNLATAMVINGEAGFQMMGDWAKGEFLNAGQVPGEDFLCFRFPGTQDQVTFNADQFMMFDQGGAVSAEQAALASAWSFAVGAALPLALAWLTPLAIMVPIAVPIAMTLGIPVPLLLAAALSGGIFGDHASPISDTTVLASMASASDHIEHVRTQLPYALIAAAIATIGFLLVGLVT